MERVICVLIGYAFGLIQTGYIYGMMNHVDIRKHGSGNAGTTNALRTLGWKAGIITFLGDCVKSVVAVLIVRLIFAQQENVLLLAGYAGLGVVLGHNFPFYLKFKGGKGIAATAGLILAINPVMFLSIAVVFLTIVWFTQYVSLGSIVIMLLFVAEVIVYGQMGGVSLETPTLYEFYGIVVILAVLAIYRHRANIKRLMTGTENKTNLRKIGKKQDS